MTVLSSDAEISASGVLVESAVVSVVELRLIRPVQDLIRVVSESPFLPQFARILQNKSKLAAVPHFIDIQRNRCDLVV